MATTTFEKQRARGRSAIRVNAVWDTLALIGVVAGSVPLFVHGWVRVTVRLAPRNPAGSGLLRRVGAEVDKQIAAITAREVDAVASPTLWQYPNHAFQALFALLLLAAAAALVAPALSPGGRIVARVCACLSSAAAATIVAVTLARVNARIATLPARITEAMQSNPLVRQSLATTDSTPHVSGGPGWPVVVVAIGVALALLGTLAGLIAALRRSGMPAILPHTPETSAGGKGTMRDSGGSAAAIPDDGSPPDAHRDAPAV